MLKLTCTLLLLIGTCTAQNESPLAQFQGTSRLMMVFSPDTNSVNFKRQLLLIERHNFELTERNTVVVPVAFVNHGTEDHFSGENVLLGSANEQASARARFHVQPDEFLVILLKADGTEQMRSNNPLDIHELTAHLDIPPRHLLK
jgi:Domain of unknown function (DUF4174)